MMMIINGKEDKLPWFEIVMSVRINRKDSSNTEHELIVNNRIIAIDHINHSLKYRPWYCSLPQMYVLYGFILAAVQEDGQYIFDMDQIRNKIENMDLINETPSDIS